LKILPKFNEQLVKFLGTLLPTAEPNDYVFAEHAMLERIAAAV